MGFAVLGVVTMGSCKLSNHRDISEIAEHYFDEDGDVEIGKSSQSGQYKMGGAMFAAGQVKELEIDWIYDSVTVEAYDGEEVVIGEESDKQLNDTTTMHYYLEPDGTLNIEYGKPGTKMKGKTLPHKRLLVRVPRTLKLQEVVANGFGHTFVMDSVVCGKLELNNVSNRIVLNECDLREVEVNVVSADLEAAFSRMPDEIELNSVSGKTVLYVPEDAGMTVEMAGVADNFSSDLPVRYKGGKKVIGNGACHIESNSVSGNLEIKTKKSK